MNKISHKSPKNKFRVEINYSKAIKGIGSVCSFGTMSIANLESNNFYKHYIELAKNNDVDCTVKVLENKATFPEFNWVKITL